MSSNRKSPSSASPRRPYKAKKVPSEKKGGVFKKDSSPRTSSKKSLRNASPRKPKPSLTQKNKEKKSLLSAPKNTSENKRKSSRPPLKQKKAKSPKEGMRKFLVILFSVIGLFAVGLVTFLILSYTSTFKIEQVVAEPTEHLPQDELDKIVVIDPDATLLNVDTTKLEEELKKNPWVESVDISRQFPDTLHISITERKVFAMTLIGPENAAWYIGADFHWIEPAKIETEKDEAVREAALQMAKNGEYYLIYDLSADINPEAGTLVEVPILQDVHKIADGLSDPLKAEVLAFSAPARDSISLRLQNGIEIAFGSADDISSKEKVINAIMQKHENQVTYINVRNPAKPTYRKIDV